MSTVCYCGQPDCPVTTWERDACVANLRAERDALKAEIADIRKTWGDALAVSRQVVAERDALKAQVVELESEVVSWRATARDKGESSRKAAAERDSLKVQVAEAAERLDEFGQCPTLADGIQAMRLRMLALRAQVEKHASDLGALRSAVHDALPLDYPDGPLIKQVPVMGAELLRLRAQVEAARKMLARYGWHDPSASREYRQGCDDVRLDVLDAMDEAAKK